MTDSLPTFQATSPTDAKTPDGAELRIASLCDQLQWSLRNEEKLKAFIKKQGERIKELEAKLERTKEHARTSRLENDQVEQAVFDEQEARIARLEGALRQARDPIALMAEGEGSDENVYMEMADGALSTIDAALAADDRGERK